MRDMSDVLDTLKNPRQRKKPVKRKTQARTQAAAEGYVRRPSQATRKPPSNRLKRRRTINLQSPVGVFPNPAPRKKATPVITVELKHGASWGVLAIFPATGNGVENALEYAKAYARKDTAAHIRVMEK